MLFTDRQDAGKQLAQHLAEVPMDDPIIAALPRGGVPVAKEVAEALGAPLTLLMVRKLGVPGHEEFAFGALGEDGTAVIDANTVQRVGLTEQTIEAIRMREQAELERRSGVYGVAEPMDFVGRTVVIVDDGMATGSTMHAAVAVARHRGASRVIVAVPVAAQEAADSFADSAEVIALSLPMFFGAVGAFYDRFDQVSDAEVVALLH